MSGATFWMTILAVVASIPIFSALGFLIWATLRYGAVIERIFEERPVFMPLLLEPEDLGEPVSFSTTDGLRLCGSFMKRRQGSRVGVLVFCHEFLSNRWSYAPYLDSLRDAGYDIFSFDFRNHGTSAKDPSYAPLQWTTDNETADLKAALDYLRSRPDHDPAGYGLFGVSRGGGTALAVAATERDVWGVITDGAFPTRGTMTAYIARWAEIYVQRRLLLKLVPRFIFDKLGSLSRRRTEKRLGRRFPDIEKAVRRLSPRPWLQIHGARDAYIGPEIARDFFDYAHEPKELWLVADAKHNRCREVDSEAYLARLESFLAQYAPRSSQVVVGEAVASEESGERFVTESSRKPAVTRRLPEVSATTAKRAAVV